MKMSEKRAALHPNALAIAAPSKERSQQDEAAQELKKVPYRAKLAESHVSPGATCSVRAQGVSFLS